MAEPYKNRIEEFCKDAGIQIPPGFYRHFASRYAAVDMESTPPKLVAKTWFNQEDVAYYLNSLSAERSVRVLDFKDRYELLFNGSASFARGSEF